MDSHGLATVVKLRLYQCPASGAQHAQPQRAGARRAEWVSLQANRPAEAKRAGRPMDLADFSPAGVAKL